jgi:hypothetical protein
MDFFANDVYQKMVLTGEKKSVDEVLKKIPQTPIPNKAFRNLGNLKFADAGTAWGFTQTSFSNGAAYGDLDNNGTLDLVINNENGPAFIYKNNSDKINKNHSVSVLLKGNDKNTFAIGSKINVYLGNSVLSREVVPSRGFQSSVDYKQIIGLGKAAKIDSMVVIWPDRTFSKIYPSGVDTLLILQQPKNAKSFFDFAEDSSQLPFFEIEKTAFVKHEEDDNVDFYYERNIPEMLSREGPKAAVGDLNGDGTQDLYIGGTKGHPGQIYLQNSSGKFSKKSEPLFDQYSDFEDDAVLFFDAENDGDLDIFVGPGGNNSQSFSRQMQSRLYINDGKANFSIDVNAFPENGMNTGVAIAGDFNKDGFSDLFIGGRNVPREYGVSPKSYILLNNGKRHFTDIAKTKNTDIYQIGMVTDALFADVSGDGGKELIITGEWMAPRIFSFKSDHFEEVKSNLNQLFGLWKSMEAADVNHDGKTDLILGNIGENFYLRPDSANEVKLWINDFNQNGSLDKIMTNTINGKDLPVFLKHDLQDQIPSIKKQNLKHEDYANKSIQQLFADDLLKKSVVKKFNYLASIVAINQGNGQFAIQKLPMMAQLSSVNAMVCTDVNADGNTDLVLGGNLFGFLPQFERLDASFGDLLLNDGKGNFKWVEQRRTGFNVEGMVRDIVELKDKEKRILFLRNDNLPVLYKLNKAVAADKK